MVICDAGHKAFAFRWGQSASGAAPEKAKFHRRLATPLRLDARDTYRARPKVTRLAIAFSPLVNIAQARDAWIQIQPAAHISFFQSWHWMQTWLSSLPASQQLHLLTVSHDGVLVAAGICVATRHRRFGLMPVKALHLNSTGEPAHDCIAAEYGNLIAVHGHEASAWSEALHFLRSANPAWEEFTVEGARPMLLEAWTSMGLPHRIIRRDHAHFVSLERVRAAEDGKFLTLLPSRARSRIKSTRRQIESRLGPVTLRISSTVDEALGFFGELKQLHQAHWKRRGAEGAFSHSFFELFHRRLIADSFGDGSIQLARFTAGDTVLGYIYNFVHQGHVYFYQSGLNYEATTRAESPGLMLHAMMIDMNAERGHQVYDLLAGDSQYKKTLATGSEELCWFALQQPRPKFQLERWARALAGKARSLRQIGLKPGAKRPA